MGEKNRGMTAKTKRIYKWDNLKMVLIFLVVLGHFMNELTLEWDNMKSLYFFIYLFHMPLFLFVSGMFSRKTVNDPIKRRERIIGYVILGFILRFINLAIKIGFGKWNENVFRMWKENGLSWYLFALAMYLGITWLLRDLDRRFLFIMAVVTALFAGYDSTLGSTLVLSRFFVFYPFFLLGYFTDPSREWKRIQGKGWKMGAAAVLLVAFVIVYTNITELWKYRDLIMGWNSYVNLPVPEMGGWYRLLFYLVAILLGSAVIILIPNERGPLTAVGQRTLQIYFWHRPILYILVFLHWEEWLCRIWPSHWKLLYLLVSLLLTVALSWKGFGVPLDYFWRAISARREDAGVKNGGL
ncbi:MAG: acyltransferase family protein [Clostridiales bacterium]|nr:acyltransferase family protein [Clostridiales bacterium]